MVSIFFDLENPFDSTWIYGIMKDLHDMDLRGRLPLFIQNFLSERKFRFRVGHPSLTFMIKKLEFLRGAHYLSPFLLSKSTASPVA